MATQVGYYRFDNVTVDVPNLRVTVDGTLRPLEPKAFRLLQFLMENRGRAVPEDEILSTVWRDAAVSDNTLTRAVTQVRKALGDDSREPRYVETVPTIGYRFLPEFQEQTEPPPPSAPIRNSWLSVLIAAVLLGAVAITGWLWRWDARAPVRNWTFSLSLGPMSELHGGVVVSPDGSAVIYGTSRGMALRRLDFLSETPIDTQAPLTDTPSWSPDGSQILCRYGFVLSRVPLPDGPPAILWPNSSITRGFSWGPDGTILVATLTNGVGALALVPAKGGDPVRVEVPGFVNGRFYYPEFAPDQKNILFAWGADDDDVGLYLATLEHGKITRGPILLRRNMTAGHYAALGASSGGGRLLYVQNDTLYAQKLDLRRGKLEGDPERVVDGVHSAVGRHRASFSVSRSGVLVWTAGRAGLAQLTWFDRTGKVLSTAGPPCSGAVARLSPDESHVLLETIAEHVGYGIVEQGKSGQVVLPRLTTAPLWMPGSLYILYSRREGNNYHLLERAAEGGAEKELVRVPALATLRDVSMDGKVLQQPPTIP
jgi:DNA-binding winged helix-turn-helix (wHTH) protein